MTETETIPGTTIPMTHKKLKWFEVTPTKLLKWRKMFLLLTAMAVIALVIDLYVNGLTMIALIDVVMAMAMFNFSTKCETMYLKLKIETALEKLEV